MEVNSSVPLTLGVSVKVILSEVFQTQLSLL